MLLALTLLAAGVVLALVAWVVVCQPVWGAPAPAAFSPPGMEDALRRHVQVLAGSFALRDAEHPDVLEAAADYIRSTLAALGGQVETVSFAAEDQTYCNVIATFGPRTGPRVVVGAHYDAPPGSPGADDNASGVAGLLELARLLGREQPAGRVDLVAFALEELPYFGTDGMGSAAHVRRLVKEGATVRAMLSLEMIGYFDARARSQRYPAGIMRAVYPSRGNFVLLVGRWADWRELYVLKRTMRAAAPLDVRTVCLPAGVPEIDRSDHASFWKAGFPGAMITDTAQYRNPGYHSEMDTPDMLNYAAMAEVVVGVHAWVRALCGVGVQATPTPRVGNTADLRAKSAAPDAMGTRSVLNGGAPVARTIADPHV